MVRRNASMMRPSFVVLTHVFLAVVIGEAFGAGNTAAPDNSGLQVGDNGVDLLRSQRAGGGIEIVGRRAERSGIAGANLVGSLIEGRHASPARTATTDRELQGRGIEP